MIYEIELIQDEETPFERVQTSQLFFAEFDNDAEALGFINTLDGQHKFDYQLVFRPARAKGKNGRLYRAGEHEELAEFIEAYLKDDAATIRQHEAELEDDEADVDGDVF